MFFQIIKFVISDTFESENNANYSEIFSVINLSDNKSIPGSFLGKSKSFYIPHKWILWFWRPLIEYT